MDSRPHREPAGERPRHAAFTDLASPAEIAARGASLERSGELEGAEALYARALASHEDLPEIRLRRGRVLERLGRSQEALRCYFIAVYDSQAASEWCDPSSTPPHLRELVSHASRFIHREREALMSQLMEGLRRKYGTQDLLRVQKCVSVYLQETIPSYPDSRQRPVFLYFPDLPTQPYYERALFPWIQDLEDRTPAIQSEVRAVRYSSRVNPLHKNDQRIKRAQSGWDTYFLYRYGERFDASHRQCPATSQALGKLPLCRVRRFAPESLFSFLAPRTAIPEHCGVTNVRLILHLPLEIWPECELNVGGERHAWREGRCVVFDDTFVHSARNGSDRLRSLLLTDIWNPHVAEVERDALSSIISAIADFGDDPLVPDE